MKIFLLISLIDIPTSNYYISRKITIYLSGNMFFSKTNPYTIALQENGLISKHISRFMHHVRN